MKNETLEVVRGSGNVFRDFGYDNADVEQLKARLAAEIIKRLDNQGFSVRRAQEYTGVDAADFSRIRNADLSRFTSDRLMTILKRLGARFSVSLKMESAPRVVRSEVGKRRPAKKADQQLGKETRQSTR